MTTNKQSHKSSNRHKMKPRQWRNKSSLLILAFMLFVMASSFIEKLIGKTPTLALMIIIPVLILLADLYFWRCTACNKYLPQAIFSRITHCRKCGKEIE